MLGLLQRRRHLEGRELRQGRVLGHRLLGVAGRDRELDAAQPHHQVLDRHPGCAPLLLAARDGGVLALE
jgi:hypothetical protein